MNTEKTIGQRAAEKVMGFVHGHDYMCFPVKFDEEKERVAALIDQVVQQQEEKTDLGEPESRGLHSEQTGLTPREWLLAGGGGFEGGEDAFRAVTYTCEGLVLMLEAYREDLEEQSDVDAIREARLEGTQFRPLREVLTDIDGLRDAAEEALLALAIWKISDKAKPYAEVGEDLRKQFLAAHDLLFNALSVQGSGNPRVAAPSDKRKEQENSSSTQSTVGGGKKEEGDL